ncbi:MAG: alpha/beta fold hydrolase BchO [Wenzhouxiangella sp.]
MASHAEHFAAADGVSPLCWDAVRGRWPHAEASSFHRAGGLRWHVQTLGEGPPLLLIHGTGASTHSWRSLAPILAQDYRVIMPDLPGHALTETPASGGLTLPAMAAALSALLAKLCIQPVVVVGHSAGAAILIRCCLDGSLAPQCIISINGALLPFRGHAGYLFPSLAKLLFLNPLTPRMLARSAQDTRRVDRLIQGTGSRLDDGGLELYRQLFSNTAHVRATLGMMAGWDLHTLVRNLPSLRVPLALISADLDKAVPASDAEKICDLLPGTQRVTLPGLGHLAHEEDAALVAQHVRSYAMRSHRNGRPSC